MKTAKDIAIEIRFGSIENVNSYQTLRKGTDLIEAYADEKIRERTSEQRKDIERLRLALMQCKALVKSCMGEGSDLFLRVDEITERAIRKFES